MQEQRKRKHGNCMEALGICIYMYMYNGLAGLGFPKQRPHAEGPKHSEYGKWGLYGGPEFIQKGILVTPTLKT